MYKLVSDAVTPVRGNFISLWRQFLKPARSTICNLIGVVCLHAMNNKILQLAKKLWDYHHVNHVLEPADCILALGSHDLRVAERAADLYLEGYASILILSGGLGNFTKGLWTKSEADLFAEVAVKKGVPERDILIENKSSNTGENILFTQLLLKERAWIQKDSSLYRNHIWRGEALLLLKSIGLKKN